MGLKSMNISTRLSVIRMIFTLIVIIFLIFPFYSIGIDFPSYSVSGILVDMKMIIAGVVFILAVFVGILEHHFKSEEDAGVENFKILNTCSDKLLIESVLIVFSFLQYIHPIVPIVVVLADSIIDRIQTLVIAKGRIASSIKTGKIKTFCLTMGMLLMFFYNLPFTLMNLQVDLFFIYFGMVMAIASGVEYYAVNKKFFARKKEKELEVI